MFGAIAGGIASALAGGAMSKLFGGGQKAASGGIQGDVLATDNNTVGMGDAGIKSRSEERFSRNAETDLVCRLLLEKKSGAAGAGRGPHAAGDLQAAVRAPRRARAAEARRPAGGPLLQD